MVKHPASRPGYSRSCLHRDLYFLNQFPRDIILYKPRYKSFPLGKSSLQLEVILTAGAFLDE